MDALRATRRAAVRFCLIPAFAFLLFSSGLEAGEPEAPAPEVLQPSFDWPLGVEAWVDWRLEERSVPEDGSEVLVEGRYRLEVNPHPRGRLLNHGRETLEIQHDPSGFWAILQRYLEGMKTGYVASRSGELIQVLGTEALQKAMRETMTEAVRNQTEGAGQDPAEIEEVARELFSEDAILTMAKEDWDIEVLFWVGKELEAGEVYALEEEQPSPLNPEVTIPVVMEYRWAGNQPCSRAGQERVCAQLELEVIVESEALLKSLETLVEGATGEAVALGDKVEKLEAGTSWRLVTEPDGLLPHRVHKETRVILKMSAEGEALSVERLEISASEYSYDPK